ncbi:NAD-dependent epimerase/dehydratase family protein [Amycolatopsis sp. NPDC051061]|uniref:NAD-dependent epimerase/dehydratase family protein n=1 Tax=Amycolatopsis sp. NPDC051061 TaxID=3155042 RepID=UPI0034420EAD
MKVFLTGGSGYVGRPTVRALRRHGHEVGALARSDASARVLTSLGASPVRGDLTATDVLREAAAAADGVIHLGQHYGDDTAEVDLAAAEALQSGLGGGLIEAFFGAPVPLIGNGANRWALVHAADLAELYVLALHAPPKSVYAGVSGQNVRLADIVSALAAGGPIAHLTLAEAVARMGPIAEAFALDQRLTPARARRELGWEPRHLDALAELRG